MASYAPWEKSGILGYERQGALSDTIMQLSQTDKSSLLSSLSPRALALLEGQMSILRELVRADPKAFHHYSILPPGHLQINLNKSREEGSAHLSLLCFRHGFGDINTPRCFKLFLCFI